MKIEDYNTTGTNTPTGTITTITLCKCKPQVATALSAADLRQWQTFGGIDAALSADGTSVLLDTHDTTDTWATKWSGLIAPGESRCTVHFHARVRDRTHSSGLPGGYGVGLGSLDTPDEPMPTLDGWGLQYDFGQQGYRTALYPSDGDTGLVSATLDHEWHEIDLLADEFGELTETVDGTAFVRQRTPGGCGHPVIRVWAGAVEFANVVVS